MNKIIIKRNKYLNKISKFINKDIVKVIIWQRRVWKSYILKQIIEELKDNLWILESEIIYINKEDLKWDFIKDYNDLFKAVEKFRYIFIDEIQDIESWEKAIRSLQSTWNHDIYITGSNSNMLSSELSTFLSGRYVSFNIYPLDYKEFLEFHSLEKSEENFMKYLKFGWLPYLKNLELNEEIVYSYLKDVVNTILLKDVISRNNIRNIDFYKKLITYLSTESWSIFSAKNISDYLKSQKVNLSPNIVLNYLEYSINACFLNKVSRYDIKWKRYFEIKDKFFFTDIGIKNVLIWGYSKIHISWILENIVFCNLVSNWWEVNIWEIWNKEVDFVCKKDSEIMYVQVAYILESDKTRDREFSSLLDIKDSWPKYVITMDKDASWKIEWIEWKNIDDFIYEL